MTQQGKPAFDPELHTNMLKEHACKDERVFTWKEIFENNQLKAPSGQPAKNWVVVRGGVYDITDYIDKHPGGRHVLEMSAGQDITYLMETSHPFTDSPWRLLGKYRIGRIAEEFVTYQAGPEPLWYEARQKVKEYFQKNKLDPKDPLPPMLAFIFISCLFFLGYAGLLNGWYSAALLLGVSRALFGIHTMHMTSHFAVSHKPWVWKWLDWVCFDLFMGGSSLSWNYQHVVGHHQHTNVFQADPDLPCTVEGDMRRCVPQQKWTSIYRYQHIYMPILYTLLAFKTRYTDMLILFGDLSNGPLTMTVSKFDWNLMVGTKLFFVFYQFLAPWLFTDLSLGQVLALYAVAELASGTWLAYFFQVNHISYGLRYTTAQDATSREWAAIQIEGSADYGHGSFLHNFLSGTLNYQTVHHLFPSVANHHYPAIAPIVQELCKKYKVQYTHHPNFFVAFQYHLKELRRLGELGQPVTVEMG